MLTILLHSSKTMRTKTGQTHSYQAPALLPQATQLAGYIKTLSVIEIQQAMHVSKPMATKVHQAWQAWTTSQDMQVPAIDAFIGDIYSGLQVQSLSAKDRSYANQHLYILSGLYGVLRALDDIFPYRLEMGYRFPGAPYNNLYSFWHSSIADCLPTSQPIVNLSAVEYTKAVLPYLPDTTVVTPKFMTKDVSSDEPKFVVVHAKIARGAFARWLIQNRVGTIDALKEFSELGYHVSEQLSTPEQPVFICDEFRGLGLSVRLT